MAVEAPFEDTGARNAGAVYLYGVSAAGPPDATLTLRQTLAASTPQPHGKFGAAVALHGDLLLVGSPGREVEDIRHRGAVYRYRRQPSGQWATVGELTPAAASETEFGIEVAVNDTWQAGGSAATGCATVRPVPDAKIEGRLPHVHAIGRSPTSPHGKSSLGPEPGPMELAVAAKRLGIEVEYRQGHWTDAVVGGPGMD